MGVPCGHGSGYIQGAGRKQMAHSKGAIKENLMKRQCLRMLEELRKKEQ